ncbi:hypothetical protein A9Q79_04375 [Methylophaga sp. 42_25_T18]|nr:hypothetical protein A9Q79_04375 [Methylophaga sp. 42_25_T18]OUR89760.1 hypothetical protein A9Q92_00460 [Methylophaga sp. 42_8_T64]
MVVDSTNKVMNAAKESIALDESLFSSKADTAQFYLENVNLTPTTHQVFEVAHIIKIVTGINCDTSLAKIILTLYPTAKIQVAVYGTESDAKDEILWAVSHFFLGCPWPTFEDNVELTDFILLLQQQASSLGFNICRPLNG